MTSTVRLLPSLLVLVLSACGDGPVTGLDAGCPAGAAIAEGDTSSCTDWGGFLFPSATGVRCECPASDTGRPCSRQGDCLGTCVARAVEGTCSSTATCSATYPGSACGCFLLDDGRRTDFRCLD